MFDFELPSFTAIFNFIFPFLKAVLIVVIGYVLVGYVAKLLEKTLNKANLDQSLVKFLVKAAKIVLLILVALSALSAVGISTTGIIAALSASAVAVALALKDSLSNIAGGILLLVAPRFSTGDFIEVGGECGSVMNVDLMHTIICTGDKRHVVIPNGVLINSQLVNYSREPKRRVDLTFSISYDNDAELAKRVAIETMKKHPLVTVENADEEPFARVGAYSASSVDITARVWCLSENYWTVHFDLLEQVRSAFDANGISIPYDQIDVHMK